MSTKTKGPRTFGPGLILEHRLKHLFCNFPFFYHFPLFSVVPCIDVDSLQSDRDYSSMCRNLFRYGYHPIRAQPKSQICYMKTSKLQAWITQKCVCSSFIVSLILTQSEATLFQALPQLPCYIWSLCKSCFWMECCVSINQFKGSFKIPAKQCLWCTITVYKKSFSDLVWKFPFVLKSFPFKCTNQ